MESKVDVLNSPADQKLQQEFNQWAAAGRGDAIASIAHELTLEPGR